MFAQDYKVGKEIPDMFSTFSNFDFTKYLDERNFSDEEGYEYIRFIDKTFSNLQLASSEDLSEIKGEWELVNYIDTGVFNMFAYRFQRVIIGWNSSLSVYGAVGPGSVYKYGDYYLTTWSAMGSIAPILLLNIIEDRLYLYTLEGSTWKLLPFHESGEVYLKKVLPSS